MTPLRASKPEMQSAWRGARTQACRAWLLAVHLIAAGSALLLTLRVRLRYAAALLARAAAACVALCLLPSLLFLALVRGLLLCQIQNPFAFVSRRARYRPQVAPTLCVRFLSALPAYRRGQAHQLSSPPYTCLECVSAPRKRALFQRIRGGDDALVVDVGAGSGLNLRSLPASVRRVVAVEPNDACVPSLQAAAAAQGVRLTPMRACAEHIPLPSACADAVLCTCVLCSVADPQAAVRECARILRPGGLFIFLEHVRVRPDDTRAPFSAHLQVHALRLLQRLAAPPWMLYTGGCSPCRDSGAVIEALVGEDPALPFQSLDCARYKEPHLGHQVAWWGPLVETQVAGVAVRRTQ